MLRFLQFYVIANSCGHGETLLPVACRAASGSAAGIDPSDVMVRLAARRLRSEIRRGYVEVRQAEAARIPFEDARFNVALAVHVLYFWPEPTIELREIRRVLCPDGTLLLDFRPDGAEARASLPDSVYHLRSIREVEKLLRETGYEMVRVAGAWWRNTLHVRGRPSAAGYGVQRSRGSCSAIRAKSASVVSSRSS